MGSSTKLAQEWQGQSTNMTYVHPHIYTNIPDSQFHTNLITHCYILNTFMLIYKFSDKLFKLMVDIGNDSYR